MENSVTFHSTPTFQISMALQEGRNEDRVWAGSHQSSGFGSNTIWLCDPKQNTHSVPQFCHMLNDYTELLHSQTIRIGLNKTGEQGLFTGKCKCKELLSP